jgi:chromosome segregation ATPase
MPNFRVSAISLVTLGTLAGFAINGVRPAAQVPGTLPRPTVQQPDLMPELLAEVKALRADVGEAVRVSIRSQMLLTRLQVEEQRIFNLERWRADVASRRTQFGQQRAWTAAQLRHLESRRSQAPAGPEREGLDAQVRMLRGQIEQQQSNEGQLRREEAQVASSLSATETRRTEFDGQLRALERAFSTPPQ